MPFCMGWFALLWWWWLYCCKKLPRGWEPCFGGSVCPFVLVGIPFCGGGGFILVKQLPRGWVGALLRWVGSVHGLCTQTLYTDSAHRLCIGLCTQTLYKGSVHRLRTQTSYTDSVHRLCTLTSCNGSLHRLCTQTSHTESVYGHCTHTHSFLGT